MAFCAIKDDQGFPFFQLTCIVKLGGFYHNIVAKRTPGVLTDEERLRLGLPRSEIEILGPQSTPSTPRSDKESYQNLVQRLQEHTIAQADILEKLVAMTGKMDEELRSVERTGQQVKSLLPHLEQEARNRKSMPI